MVDDALLLLFLMCVCVRFSLDSYLVLFHSLDEMVWIVSSLLTYYFIDEKGYFQFLFFFLSKWARERMDNVECWEQHLPQTKQINQLNQHGWEESILKYLNNVKLKLPSQFGSSDAKWPS